jgi:glycosyltransferase involved in cell wall biosynthesis
MPVTEGGRLSICFVDLIEWDYDVSTPLSRPLGGSQSAACYLSVELAKRGHRVVLYNFGSANKTITGVECVSVRQNRPKEYFACHQFDAIVVVNGPAILANLKLDLALTAKTILALWTQHAFDQPWMQPLTEPGIRNGWDRIVCVSDWHRRTMIEAFALNPNLVDVRRNAIGPAFENLFGSAAELAAAKQGSLKLAYTSTPGRGLDVLLAIFPRIAADCELDIYSSMAVYQVPEQSDAFRALYERARSTKKVSYLGSMGQAELARRLRGAAILSYPNTYHETSCISVMEAMAAGLFIVTGDLGALPETSMTFGKLVPNEPGGTFPNRYEAELVAAIDRPPSAEQLFAAMNAVNASCRWSQRAAEWERMITSW